MPTHSTELNKKMKKILVIGLAVACAVAHAESGEGQYHRKPEIAAACEGKAVGTKVSVTFKDGQSREIECGMHHHHHQEEGGASGASVQPQ
jgi:hypothetical protein